MSKKYLVLGLIVSMFSHLALKAETITDARLTGSSLNTKLGSPNCIDTSSTYVGKNYNINSCAYHNTAVGADSMINNKRVERRGFYGGGNSAFGSASLNALTTGEYNTGVGLAALQFLTTGSNNTAIGEGALNKSITNSNNTSLGFMSLAELGGRRTTGDNGNTAIGFEAGRELSRGVQNILIGYKAGKSNSTTLISGRNNILIGNEVSTSAASASNELNIGNLITGVLDGSKSVKVNGTLTAGTLSSADTLNVSGQSTLGMVNANYINGINLRTGGLTVVSSARFDSGATVSKGDLSVSDGTGYFKSIKTSDVAQFEKSISFNKQYGYIPTAPSGKAYLYYSGSDGDKLVYRDRNGTAAVMIAEQAGLSDLSDVSTINNGVYIRKSVTVEGKLKIIDAMNLQPRAFAPANAMLGDLYMDSTGVLCAYNGNDWDKLGAGREGSNCHADPASIRQSLISGTGGNGGSALALFNALVSKGVSTTTLNTYKKAVLEPRSFDLRLRNFPLQQDIRAAYAKLVDNNTRAEIIDSYTNIVINGVDSQPGLEAYSDHSLIRTSFISYATNKTQPYNLTDLKAATLVALVKFADDATKITGKLVAYEAYGSGSGKGINIILENPAKNDARIMQYINYAYARPNLSQAEYDAYAKNIFEVNI